MSGMAFGAVVAGVAGSPNCGAMSGAASATGSGEVEVSPTDCVNVTVMRSGGGGKATETGFQASHASSRTCSPAATASPTRSSLEIGGMDRVANLFTAPASAGRAG